MEHENEVRPHQDALLPFDPIVLVRDALRKWALILTVALICGMLSYVYTDSVYEPQYRTSATLVVTTRESSTSVYTNLESTTTLANVFTEILNSSVMRNNILDELQMDSFNGTIQASAIVSTNLLSVTVTAGDPRTAFRVMDVLLEKHDMVTYSVMGDIVLEVLEHPVVPTYPINRVNAAETMKKVTLFVAAATFVLLMIYAFFKDVVRSRDEAEQKLDCWCLGEIMHEKKNLTLKDLLLRRKRSILITKPGTGFRYVTTINKLRRRVEQHMHKGKILMVTSVMENEGKSTVAANLALAMAKKHQRVLLIDGDLHKPACRKIMEHEPAKYNIHDVINGKVSLKDAVCRDKLSNMDMLFAKRFPPADVAGLISSDGLVDLLRQAREQYDMVVVDLPPMSVVSDPEVVMEHADASLLVVRQNGVRTTDLNRAIANLQRGKAKMLGCVLNNVYKTGVLSGEGYAAGYGRYGAYGKYGRYSKYGRYGTYASKFDQE